MQSPALISRKHYEKVNFVVMVKARGLISLSKCGLNLKQIAFHILKFQTLLYGFFFFPQKRKYHMASVNIHSSGLLLNRKFKACLINQPWQTWQPACWAIFFSSPVYGI